MKYLMLVMILIAGGVKAGSLDISPYASEDGGVLIGYSNEGDIKYSIGVNLSQNLGGPQASIGFKYGLEWSLGYMTINVMENRSGVVDVQGVDVRDPRSDGSGNGLFLEGKYKSFFARIVRYEVDYDYRATRTTPLQIISGEDSETVKDTVLWAGYRFSFN